jgi:P27 family predicted phage terminase small subunit
MRQRGANKHAESLKKAGDLRSGLPEMPKDLDGLAKEHWEYLTNVAGAQQLFREADAGTLGGLCQAYEGFMQHFAVSREMANLALDKNLEPKVRGEMADRGIDAAKMAEKLYGRYLNGADRLGLSPVARARLQFGSGEAKQARPFGVMPSPEEWKRRKSGVSA